MQRNTKPCQGKEVCWEVGNSIGSFLIQITTDHKHKKQFNMANIGTHRRQIEYTSGVEH